MAKKACLIFVPTMQAQAEGLSSTMSAQAYEVCLTEASIDEAGAAQQGFTSVTPQIEACINGADLTIILVPPVETPSSMINAANRAAGTGGRLVAVYADAVAVHPIFDQVANSVVSCDSPNLIAALILKDIHEKADGLIKPLRNPIRVKCQ